ncbi:hypothetical protein [Paenibacillus pasadenensis]|uniref:hypothetical protein n=1 Tax=Paenibacillus pasadenensis TaxID=217090 RepID=UPI000C7A6CCE|nr:hypothetical protein [Paenibacillus pasadenensis]
MFANVLAVAFKIRSVGSPNNRLFVGLYRYSCSKAGTAVVQLEGEKQQQKEGIREDAFFLCPYGG